MIRRISGKVIHGKGNGKKKLLPTFNLYYDEDIKERGVYISKVYIDDKKYIGVTNIGKRPTVDDDEKIVIETYIIDFDGNLYDKEIEFDILEKIRDTKKFDSIEDLKNQIENDIIYAKSRSKEIC